MIYERVSKSYLQEPVYRANLSHFLYNTVPGGLLRLIATRKICNRIYGFFQKTKRSAKRIKSFAKQYNISVDDFAKYQTFNDFFIRKEVRRVDSGANTLISPADSCLTVYHITKDTFLQIKERRYTISRLIGDQELAKDYDGGYALVFRLAVYDCHRFCFPTDGEIICQKKISGILDSVNMKETGKCSLCTNARIVHVLATDLLGQVVFVEVGAMLVGKMVHTHTAHSFAKGEEKGYFEFGGSTIVMLLKPAAVAIDEDILQQSQKAIETKVLYGERIGKGTLQC
ncbi:MAG: phosphatidylserine decarboxylase [Clostridium sp.]|jgi:phosphatidylserine decarboxylase|nr:phosphatidylserine decarboxylase [Clostridium sp.]